jgi:hypothetical protein
MWRNATAGLKANFRRKVAKNQWFFPEAGATLRSPIFVSLSQNFFLEPPVARGRMQDTST